LFLKIIFSLIFSGFIDYCNIYFCCYDGF
jgi:hypothetical protein